MLGGLGVFAFGLTLPATRAAVAELDGTLVGLGRALVAAALAEAVLLWRKEPVPERRLWSRLAAVAVSVVYRVRYSRRWLCRTSPRPTARSSWADCPPRLP